MTLSKLAILLGAIVAAPNAYGLFNPAKFAESARRFPRSKNWGYVLMPLATVWFLWVVHNEPTADFARFKNLLLAAFGALGVLTCIYVSDFLAVRGLAVLMLLMARLMVDTGRPHLGETPWVLLIQGWAYLLVLVGMWLTVAPWRARDLIEWANADERRTRVTCAARLAFGLLVAGLGLSVFK